MKRTLGLWIFGIINIVLGIIPTLFLIFEFILLPSFIIMIFLFTFLGWVTDREFVSFGDWFLLTIVGRGSLIILYIFSLFLFWSGLTMIRPKTYSRKFSIISITGLSLAWIVYFASGVLHPYLYRDDRVFDVNAIRISLYLSFGLLIYALSLIRYLTNPKIKELFDDTNVKFPFKRIGLLVLIILIIIFGHLLIPLFGLQTDCKPALQGFSHCNGNSTT